MQSGTHLIWDGDLVLLCLAVLVRVADVEYVRILRQFLGPAKAVRGHQCVWADAWGVVAAVNRWPRGRGKHSTQANRGKARQNKFCEPVIRSPVWG